jgi:tetratricopeptide (TPR) repeat protein
MQTAVGHHQAGRLDQAELLYRQVLDADPAHADALHLLGVVTHQRGLHAQAIPLIERAVELNPGAAAYHTNLAETYRAVGDLGRAAAHGRLAAQLAPDSAEARYNLAVALQQQGQRSEAIPLFEAALERSPYWAAPYVNLGNVLREEGQPYEALAVYREGVRLAADKARLENNLGQLLFEMGQAGEALPHSQEAVRLQPEQPAALTNLGNVLAGLGRFDEARGYYQRALQLDPALALAYHGLGQVFQEEGRLDEAQACFSQAIRLDPEDPPHHCMLAGVLYEKEQEDEAIARFRLVLQHRPQHAEAHNSLGYILQDRGDAAGARAAFLEAVRVKPDYADAYLNLGLLQSEAGETQQALETFRTALRHDPNHPEALAALGLALRDRLPSEDLATIEHLLAEGRMAGKKRPVLLYGLCQVLDARNHYSRAAECARQANAFFQEAAVRRRQAYDPEEHRRYVEQIIAAYSREHFGRVRGWGVETDLPVFIVGLPRSGTSLTEQILASHPQVFGAGELNLARDAYRSIPGLVGKQAPGVECVGDLTRPVVQTLASQYLGRLRQLDARAARIVDKMPDNYLMLGLIVTLFPNARAIHTRRDVRDVGLSCWMTHFKHIRWSYQLEDIATRIREYERLMEHWRKVLPVPLLEVDYEETVADLEGVARRLVSWCGLEWDPACLAFWQTKRVVRTASMTQVREPVYNRSVGRWKHYPEDLAPLLQALGERGVSTP